MSYKQMTGNIISATKVEPVGTSEAGAASGVWNLDDQYDYKRGANWPEAGVADPDTLIESNFSTFLYVGSESSPGAIVNGIDLANKGGLVWIGQRDDTRGNHFFDTERGANKHVLSDTTAAEVSDNNTLNSFTSTGFVLGGDSGINANNGDFVSWSFKQAPKFFDVVTYTGTGSARTVAHSLGGTVGMILIKNLDQADNWAVYHRANTAAPETDYLILNTKAGTVDSAAWWNDTAPTTSVFTVGTDHAVNADGENYVAYVFAHETGDDSMIQCGSYTGNANATGPSIALGWEPQWVMIKHATAGVDNHWYVVDSMRGMTIESNAVGLLANANNAELTNFGEVQPVATGFKIAGTTGTGLNANGGNYVYMAIRRPDMATITDATEVFAVGTRGAVATADRADGWFAGFPIDLALDKTMDSNPNHMITWRKGHLNLLARADNDSQFSTGETDEAFDSNTHFNTTNSVDTDAFGYMFKRAKGFFDLQMYNGTGSAKTEAHRLQVAPELMLIKNGETQQTNWAVYYGDNTDYLILNTTAATADDATWWNDTSPTSSVFTVGTATETNADGVLYLALLFATLAGVSKVGSVTHSGSSTDVACGFSAGARFVLIKRTDATGNWYVFDTTNGIIGGNDPHWTLDLRGTSTTNADLIDPLAAGFTLTGDFPDGDYIFLAIA